MTSTDTAGTAAGSAISLPQGGGAVQGLGEKFAPDLFTGTGNMSVPLTVPAGRHGAAPSLSLGYSSGNGTGVFGLGWQLGLPGVSRKTSHGVPRYLDAAGPGGGPADVFLLSGAEDLVPVAGTYPGRVRYRPRTEGLFARIEHVRDATGDYWEVRSKDGSLTRYGTRRPAEAADTWRDPAVTADPRDASRVFGWRITETVDPLGNPVRYAYLADAGTEQGRLWSQPLLAGISYADYGDRADPAFLVSVDFVYSPRPDPFSEYRAGFEVRTSVRCDTVRVTTHAADGVARVAREYRLAYRQAEFNGVSLLTGVTEVGIGESGTPTSAPTSAPAPAPEEPLPPLTFGYSDFDPAGRRFSPVSGPGFPATALNGPTLALVDLHGAGLPDIVELGAAARVWRNAGGGRFEPPRSMAQAPPLSLAQPGVRFLDADGDGRPDLFAPAAGTPGQEAGPTAGYFPMAFAGGWSSRGFTRYPHSPAVSAADPRVKLVDLDGDGLTDVLRSGSRLQAWFNDRDPRTAWRRSAVGAGGPPVDLADPRVRLADMTGDGLQDLVLLRNGNVSYRPNLGHNRWGAQVRMRDAPRLPDGYDPRRVLLGDVDGDGAADLLYLDNGRVLLWGNRSGNGWTVAPVVVRGTPSVSGTDVFELSDLYGTGMAGLLLSRPASVSGGPHVRFLDFTGGVKPHLLTAVDNSLGAVTRITYAPSTQEYLRDFADPATRWRTTLPFPVQVVTRTEVADRISGGTLSTGYRYRHGYWDGAEREFRGFALVEHLDTETFGEGAGAGVPDGHHAPPVLTRSWFHCGPVAAGESGDWSELDLGHEYWRGDAPMLSRPADQVAFLAGLPRDARRSALRTLRGQALRTEVFALDDSALSDRPYTVTENLSGVREEETAGPPDRQRVFFPFSLGTRTTRWERGPEPMTQFAYPTGYDAYGFATGAVSVAVPRGRDPLAVAAPSAVVEPYLATCTTTQYARRDDAGHYLVDRVARTTDHEVVNDGRLPVPALREAILAGPAEGTGVSLRVIGHTRTHFDGEAFVGLALGVLGEYGLPTRTESLAFTDAFLDGLYRTGDPLAVGPRPVFLGPGPTGRWPAEYPAEFRTALPALAGYRRYAEGDVPGSPGGFYIVSGRHRYDVHVPGRVPRGMPVAVLDPFGAPSTTDYDEHDLLAVRTTDAAGLAVSAVNDHRMLLPREVTDVNGNSTSVTFSPAGLVVAQFVRGKNGEGDLDVPSVRTVYDLHAFARRGRPASVRSFRRTHHVAEPDVAADERDEVIASVVYCDGFGRVLQTRSQAEDTLFGDPAHGGGTLPADDLTPVGDAAGRTRAPGGPDNVVVSGWQVYDNKGRAVWKFEPFFSTGYDFAPPSDAQLGRKATVFHDPCGRVERTVNPDSSEKRTVFGIPADLADPGRCLPTPWESYTYDANDNAGRTHPAQAQPYAEHWNTPASAGTDALGRTITAVARNGREPSDRLTTRSSYDIRGNLVAVTDALGREAFRYSFDLAGRRWRTDSADAGRRDTVPDALGNVVDSRDSKGALTLGAFDLLQRPTRVWARDDSEDTVTLRQRIDYGDAGTPAQRPAEREGARGRNLLGRVVQHRDEAGCVATGSVDFKGNVVQLTRTVIADAPVLATYERAAAAGWQVRPFRADWTPGPGQTQAQRDAQLLEPAAYVTSAQYDALNRVKRRFLPVDVEGNRHVLYHAYDRAGALEQVQLDSAVHIRRIAYDAKGQRSLIVYGNGVMTRCAYDPYTLRLVRLRSERCSVVDAATYRPTGPALQDIGHDYDLTGNLTTLRDRTPGSGVPGNPEALSTASARLRALLGSGDALDRHFTYDPTYRLVAATGREHQAPPTGHPWIDLPRGSDATRAQPYTETYRHDPVGGIVRLVHAGTGGFTRDFTTSAGGNRLHRMTVGALPYDYGYDPNGNLTTETSSRYFAWNHADRLVAFATQTPGAEPSVHAHYLYDAGGQRVKKLVRRQGGAVEVTHYLDGIFEHRRWSGPQPGTNNHIHVTDELQRAVLVRVGAAHPDDRGPATAFHLADHLGSSTTVVDGTGAFVNREEYTPYGETSFGGYARKRYRFTGRERDEESGLGHHQARFYAPWLARWTSCDPLTSPHGASSYGYVSNNPTGLVDPNGTDDRKPAGQGGAPAAPAKAAQSPAGSLREEDIPYQKGVSGFFASIVTGGRGAAGNRRYDTLGPDQTFARELMDKRWGCTLCHVTTQVWNTWGSGGVNPQNNLPLDWTINTDGFDRFARMSMYSRAVVESALGAKTMTDGLSGMRSPRSTATRTATPPAAARPPVVSVTYTSAMASSPSDAQFGRFNIEWAQTDGPLIRGQRLPNDGALRRTARNHMDRSGFDRTGLQAMHPLDSVANKHLTPGGPVGTTYYFGDARVNASFGSQLGNELNRLGVRPGDSFTVRFVGFPDYTAVPPIAPPSSPPNLKGHR
ncbi:RHS repeat-associated protein [Streptomyces sp. V3I8]|uniref:SpvB/TcaC N-terminal domain-containing protein n=1 Tax=Streptomyces sp. V3I8 TaxID=3042279 RepID=UPI002789D03E|nr:SpvB/TcaC N-terminal domain-containing protein [Streptomyces sp. V3I8]MDQ1033660.1 RHS repeat-associated protein [Streptomyces sp. V3I8]